MEVPPCSERHQSRSGEHDVLLAIRHANEDAVMAFFFCKRVFKASSKNHVNNPTAKSLKICLSACQAAQIELLSQDFVEKYRGRSANIERGHFTQHRDRHQKIAFAQNDRPHKIGRASCRERV